MTNPIALMLAAMVAYSLPPLVGLLSWKFETPAQRVGTSLRVLAFQALCMLFWSYTMVNPDAFGMTVIAQGMVIPTVAMGVLGWSKLVPAAVHANGPSAVGKSQLRFAWTHTAIAWGMMQVFIVMAFFH